MWIACCLIILTTLCTIDASAQTPAAVYNDRMAAWHETMVATDEMRPNSCVSTYLNDRFTAMEFYTLAKFVTGVETAQGETWPEAADDVNVDDFPGGVRVTYKLSGVTVTTEIVPLMVGRDTPEQEGAAVYSVKSDPPTPLVVKCGEGATLGYFGTNRAAWLRKDEVATPGDRAAKEGRVVLLTSDQQPFTSAIKSSGSITVGGSKENGEFALIRMPEGQGHITLAYAKDRTAAKKLVSMDPRAAVNQVASYYDGLLKCRIETPDDNMNAAFRTALYNLEYNWIKPYGWNEAIHHWLALWHMQHTGAAEWIGQTERSRECILTAAQNLLPDGSVPQFLPSGVTRKDFGGSNQFFAWQVRHYWKSTGDTDAIGRIAPALDAVIRQTFGESDPDNDGLLAWGQQIGNQEDYISTPFNGTSPSIEGINMLKTAAELARGLGQTEKVLEYEVRASEITARLRSELWQTDLGRFAFYKDPLGLLRPDGQYHTLIYPVIWGILDPLDSWTSMRHLRDRLIGPSGETYCSNNFPTHAVCTAGPQAGVAQQPWAAWGLSATGLRNEAWRPLKAAADWAMNADHRGSWPEISAETTAAYFSPPAGLYVQSTIEAIFGLQVDKPKGYLKVAPCFPDHWPSARLALPDYSAIYSRVDQNTLRYDVSSSTSLPRRLVWALPPCTDVRLLVDGKETAADLTPGANCIFLSALTPDATDTSFQVTYHPLAFNVESPGSIAEGEELRINASGCEISSVEDRSGILSSVTHLSKSELLVRASEGLLSPYDGFGRLGQMTFSRRTFFLLCRAPGGVEFWFPLDVTILPRYECAGIGEVSSTGQFSVVVRNNTSHGRLTGTAHLKIARQTLPFQVDIAPGSERTYSLAIPQNALALLSPGDNTAVLVLPGPHRMSLSLTASRLFEDNVTLGEYVQSRITHIPLPDEALIEDLHWRNTRTFYAYGHYPWAASKPPLESTAPGTEITVPGLPVVSFRLNDGKFAPVSYRLNSPSLAVSLGSKKIKKLYLLVVPFLDNHDTYIPVARVDLKTTNGVVSSKTLRFPGDLDWWCPSELVGPWATSFAARPGRHGLLPILGEESGDWKEAASPAFPQSEYWAKCLAYKTSSSVMNVVEIDLERPTTLESVVLSTLGADPAFGLVAVSAEVENGQESLRDTPYMPPAHLRESAILFNFSRPGNTEGWKTEGEAFAVASVPALFDVPTLNSLAARGEMATGRAVSPDFRIGQGDQSLSLQIQGGHSAADDGPGSLFVALVDSASGEVLEKLPAPGSHVLREVRIDVRKHRNKTVHLEMQDMNTDGSYAWIGIHKVELSPM